MTIKIISGTTTIPVGVPLHARLCATGVYVYHDRRWQLLPAKTRYEITSVVPNGLERKP